MHQLRKNKESQKIEKVLKKQKIIFAFLNNSTPNDSCYVNYYPALKKLFGKVIVFDPMATIIKLGKKGMEKNFINLVEKEKAEFLFIDSRGNELTIEFLDELRRVSPETKIISYTGDDDKDFESLKRYSSLFVDCTLTAQRDYLKKYFSDGVRNVQFTIGINTEVFRPMSMKKIYDVAFIGKASNERAELIDFLITKKIPIKVFGGLWEAYPKIKHYSFGHVKPEDMAKIVNQTKINLGLSKNKFGRPSFKWRVFEIAACKSFCLTDYFEEYLRIFKNKKEIVMFKDKEDLLKKIKYYLENESEREEISKRAYKKVIKNYEVYEDFKRIFKRITEKPKTFSRNLPKVYGKIIALKKEDFRKTDSCIKNLVKKYNYISFYDDNFIPLKYKEFLQAYSLEKTKKDISCCDYYVYDKLAGIT